MKKSKMMSKTYSVRIFAFLQGYAHWRVSCGQDDDPLFSFTMGIPRQKDGLPSELLNPPREAAEVMDELFKVETPEQANEFFNALGPWQINKSDPRTASAIRFSALLEQIAFFQEALLGKRHTTKQQGEDDTWHSAYLWQPLSMELLFRQPATGRIECNDVESAIRAAVFLGRLSEFDWNRCAREDCGTVYQQKSRRQTIYCSPECGGLVSSRTYNKKPKTEGWHASI